ncbi:MAG: hypothetical protein Q9164_002856 [Protoblastenia rupestris]
MEKAFEYNPLPLGHIRLLHAKHTPGNPTWSLRPALLSSNLQFLAISYTWGPPTLVSSITCNSTTLKITKSVSELLSSEVLSSFPNDLPIWIDAICINQRDNVEKGVQVSKMVDIYGLAAEVLVWLGPTSGDSDLAMDAIRELSRREDLVSLTSAAEFANTPGVVSRIVPVERQEDLRRALGSLCCRAWFGRLWVFQEVVLARRCSIACGAKMMRWSDFAAATSAFVRLQIQQFEIVFPDVASGIRNVEGIQTLRRAAEIFPRSRDRREGISSAGLLDISQRRAVTDPRDRVYGMLGVASSNMRDKIQVDYSRNDAEALLRLYIDYGKCCIEEDSTLALLHMLSGKERMPDLPSWCPSIDAPRNYRGILRYYKAGIKTTQDGEDLPSAWFEPDSDDLYAPGCTVDVISQVVSSTFCWSDDARDAHRPSLEDATNNLAWDRECLMLYRQMTEQQDDLPFSYPLTLCGGYLYGPEQLYLLRQAYDRCISRWESVEQSIQLEDTNPEVEAAAYLFHGRLMSCCWGRKLFSTVGGRVGIGPPETETGDTVCILYGAGPLYLLRFAEEWTHILGDVYIHGLMDLEEIPDETKGENEIILIQ